MIIDPLEMQLKLRKFGESVRKVQESDFLGGAISRMRSNPEYIAALDRLIEANTALRKRRALSKPERQLAAAMRKAFITQGNDFLKRFTRLQSKFTTEALREVAAADWEPLFDDAVLATLKAFVKPIDEFTARALASGMISAVADLSVETSFTLEHPAAVEFLKNHGTDTVEGIQQTTRNQLRTLLTQATEEGWPYNRTAKAIKERFAGFAGPPVTTRSPRIRSRAMEIAVYETGSAYEEGNLIVARGLADAGLDMEQKWLSVGDSRVRPAHRANEAQGWIALGETFQDGSANPPTDGGCRCTLLHRRKPDA